MRAQIADYQIDINGLSTCVCVEGSSRVAGSAPHYFPPPEEIQDEEEGGEGGKGGGERVVEGASPVTVSHHLSQSPGLVFVERAGQPTRPLSNLLLYKLPCNDVQK